MSRAANHHGEFRRLRTGACSYRTVGGVPDGIRCAGELTLADATGVTVCLCRVPYAADTPGMISPGGDYGWPASRKQPASHALVARRQNAAGYFRSPDPIRHDRFAPIARRAPSHRGRQAADHLGLQYGYCLCNSLIERLCEYIARHNYPARSYHHALPGADPAILQSRYSWDPGARGYRIHLARGRRQQAAIAGLAAKDWNQIVNTHFIGLLAAAVALLLFIELAGVGFNACMRTIATIVCIALIPTIAHLYPLPFNNEFYAQLVRQPWLPAETFTLSSGQKIVGYSLSDDGSWTEILLNDTRTIHFYLASDVAGRRICQIGQAQPMQPLITLTTGETSVSPRTPPCLASPAASSSPAPPSKPILPLRGPRP